MEITANQRMDAILTFLNQVYEDANIITYVKQNDGTTIQIPKEPKRVMRNWEEILWGSIVESKNERYVVREFQLILEYLTNVENLIENINNEYKTLWKGKVFIEDGGFCESQRLRLLENQRKIQNDRLLIQGSWFAGIAAICLFLFELYKFCFEHKIVFVCH